MRQEPNQTRPTPPRAGVDSKPIYEEINGTYKQTASIETYILRLGGFGQPPC